jgi:uncharacterized protein YbjT (DUF2867 family)
MGTAFVTGATGYTGRAVVRALVDGGHRAVAHVRPDSSRLAHWRDEFGEQGAEVDHTPWELPAMTATLRELQPDVVFALVGTTRARMDRLAAGDADYAVASYRDIDYGLPAMLLQACLAAEIRPRYVYLSSAGVDPGRSSEYLAVRAQMEQELRDSGVPFTIARPAIITGPDREEERPLEQLAASFADGALSMATAFGFGSLKRRWGSTTAAVLAGALVRLALDEDAAGAVVESQDLR